MSTQSSIVPILETPRLLLQPLALADALAIQALFPQWEIVRYLNARIPWPYPPDGAENFLREIALPGMQRGDEWHWSLRPKSAAESLIGGISLMARPGDNRGFWLAPEWHHQGLMSEACAAVTDFWFDELGQAALQVPKAAENLASCRISERSGMRIIRAEMRDYVSGAHLSEVWEITAAEWRAHRASG
jgi:RimJ/RimL family protein N-acetyltransferase